MRKVSLNAPDWRVEAKWGAEVTALGFTAVPTALLDSYKLLGITPSQFLILVNIDSFRWDAKTLPFPSVETLAKRTNMTERNVTRNITALEQQHELIERIPRHYTSNAYSFDPIKRRLTDIIQTGQ